MARGWRVRSNTPLSCSTRRGSPGWQGISMPFCARSWPIRSAWCRACRSCRRPSGAPFARSGARPQAARTPEAPAVVSENHHLAYGDLDRRATRLARHLKSLGVGAEVPVAICLERSVDLVVGILGVLKAGGAYVPLDPAYPRERLDFILRDTRAPILLTREGLLSSLQLRPPCAVCLDSAADAAAIARAGDSPLDRRPGPDDLAYVIYTSGSTGLPQGVLLTHRTLAR